MSCRKGTLAEGDAATVGVLMHGHRVVARAVVATAHVPRGSLVTRVVAALGCLLAVGCAKELPTIGPFDTDFLRVRGDECFDGVLVTVSVDMGWPDRHLLRRLTVTNPEGATVLRVDLRDPPRCLAEADRGPWQFVVPLETSELRYEISRLNAEEQWFLGVSTKYDTRDGDGISAFLGDSCRASSRPAAEAPPMPPSASPR